MELIYRTVGRRIDVPVRRADDEKPFRAKDPADFFEEGLLIIEHLDDQQSFLKEIRRVLRPKGFLIVSTPNRDVYSPANGAVNQFHVRELTREEFLKALRAEFEFCTLYAQRALTGTLLVAEDEEDRERSPRFATFEKRDDAHFESSQGL